MSALTPMWIDDVLGRVEELLHCDDVVLARDPKSLADQCLAMGEAIVETWLEAHNQRPTDARVEGFRLLALHRQAARGCPSFNACRETCREIVYQRNLVTADPCAHDIAQTLRLASMVVRHLALFVGGKLKVAGLGDFCCSSRPVRQAEYLNPRIEPA